MTDWISVEDRLPDDEDHNEYGRVLALLEWGEAVLADYTRDGRWVCDDDRCTVDNNEVAYWMPLPKPPEET